MRARHVEARDTAVPAEPVLRHPGAEPIRREVVVAREQPERLTRHDPVQVALARADRAVALDHLVRRAIDLKPHATTMASAGLPRHPVMLETPSGSVNAPLQGHTWPNR